MFDPKLNKYAWFSATFKLWFSVARHQLQVGENINKLTQQENGEVVEGLY